MVADGGHTPHGPPSVTVKTLQGAYVVLPVADGCCSAGTLKRLALAQLSGETTVRDADVRRAKLYHRGETLNDDALVGAEMLTLVLMGWKSKKAKHSAAAPPSRTAAAPSATTPSPQPPPIGLPTAFAGSPVSAKLCHRPPHTSPCLSRSPPSSKAAELAGAERQPEPTLGAAAEGNDCHLIRTGGSSAAEGEPTQSAAVETGTLAQVCQTLVAKLAVWVACSLACGERLLRLQRMSTGRPTRVRDMVIPHSDRVLAYDDTHRSCFFGSWWRMRGWRLRTPRWSPRCRRTPQQSPRHRRRPQRRPGEGARGRSAARLMCVNPTAFRRARSSLSFMRYPPSRQ